MRWTDLQRAAGLACALLPCFNVAAGAGDGASFFQIRATVPECPMPREPDLERTREGDHASEEADDAIASSLRAALSKNQLYTHSPLVHSSLWAWVHQRVVTIAGCVSGDVPPGYDHALIRTQFEKLLSSIPDVRQVVVLVRTSAQARAGEAVPYRTRP
jgi:hypothetical protein